MVDVNRKDEIREFLISRRAKVSPEQAGIPSYGAPEIAPFGIRTMLVEPGFFRTELLTPESTSYAASTIEDYAERTEQTVAAWKSMGGQQGGDPAKLPDALIQLAELDQPPLRFAAGADAVGLFDTLAKELQNQADAHRELSSNLAHDNA